MKKTEIMPMVETLLNSLYLIPFFNTKIERTTLKRCIVKGQSFFIKKWTLHS